MNHLIAARGMGDGETCQGHRIVCDSAGTASYHVGSPPDRRMNLAAQRQGITLQGSARQFSAADFEDFDLILAMDRSNYQDILSLDTGNQYAHKVKLMCEYCRAYDDKDVPDPYYGKEDGFNYVIGLLTDACEALLDSVLEEQDRQNS
jgi:protein-tyrosine phosphatase